jgi:hypothetical protein
VVAQVVEAELVVRAVGDVARVLLAPLLGSLAGQDHAAGETEEPVHAPHELGLVAGQVVVHGDDVHALAGQRVEVRRCGRDEGLALAGLHLGDVAQVQRGAAHELHVEVALAEGAAGGLADRGERLGQQVVERLALGEPGLEPVGLLTQLGVGQRGEAVLQRVDLRGEAGQLLDDPSLTEAQDLLEDRRHA